MIERAAGALRSLAGSSDAKTDALAQIADLVLKPILELELREKRGLGRQGKPSDSSAHLYQPYRQPASFKPGVTAKPDALTPKSASQDHQFFQGALPSAQSSSRYCRSLIVSMGCQKPI